MSNPRDESVTSFDWGALLDKFGGDEAFARGLLGIAWRSSVAMPAELRAAAAAGDLAAMTHLAHKVKGTAGDICAVSLRERAAAAELAARNASSSASLLNRELADALEGLLADLRRVTEPYAAP